MASARRTRSGNGRRQTLLGALLVVVLLGIAVLLATQHSDRGAAVGGTTPEPPPRVPVEEVTPPEPPAEEEKADEEPPPAEEPAPDAQAPRLIGVSVEEAKRLLDQAGMKYREDPRGAAPHRSIPRGSVIWQNPGPSEIVSPGATVTVRLSLGPPVEVPMGMEGRQYEEARAELERLGLRATRRDEHRTGVRPGTVVRLQPSHGSEVAAGSTVTLYVAQPLALVVPNVIGMSEAEARRALEAAGFQVADFVNRRHHGQIPAGMVTNTDPAPETAAEGGSAVMLAVSLGPDPAPIAHTGRLVVQAADARAGDLHFCLYRPDDADFEPLWSRLTPGGEWHLELPPGEYHLAAYTSHAETAGPAQWQRSVAIRAGKTTKAVFGLGAAGSGRRPQSGTERQGG